MKKIQTIIDPNCDISSLRSYKPVRLSSLKLHLAMRKTNVLFGVNSSFMSFDKNKAVSCDRIAAEGK